MPGTILSEHTNTTLPLQYDINFSVRLPIRQHSLHNIARWDGKKAHSPPTVDSDETVGRLSTSNGENQYEVVVQKQNKVLNLVKFLFLQVISISVI